MYAPTPKNAACPRDVIPINPVIRLSESDNTENIKQFIPIVIRYCLLNATGKIIAKTKNTIDKIRLFFAQNSNIPLKALFFSFSGAVPIIPITPYTLFMDFCPKNPEGLTIRTTINITNATASLYPELM